MQMYPGQLESIARILRKLNDVSVIAQSDGEIYVQFAPILLDHELIGFAVDEIGGAYSFVETTKELTDWYNSRPKAF